MGHTASLDISEHRQIFLPSDGIRISDRQARTLRYPTGAQKRTESETSHTRAE